MIILLTKREKPIYLGIEPTEMDHYFAIRKMFQNFEPLASCGRVTFKSWLLYFSSGIVQKDVGTFSAIHTSEKKYTKWKCHPPFAYNLGPILFTITSLIYILIFPSEHYDAGVINRQLHTWARFLKVLLFGGQLFFLELEPYAIMKRIGMKRV